MYVCAVVSSRSDLPGFAGGDGTATFRAAAPAEYEIHRIRQTGNPHAWNVAQGCRQSDIAARFFFSF